MAHKTKKKLSSAVAPVAVPPEAVFITTRELAGLLRKSLKTIYRLASNNRIAHIHDAGGLRFARQSVNEYLAARLVGSSDRTAA